MREKIKVVFCYAHEDEDLRLKLEQQLSLFKRQGIIDVWHDQNISAGADWKKEIDQHLNAAHVVLLLISPDFLASDYCYSIELKYAMERSAREEVLIIPIILRPVYWQGTSFGKLQVLPANARPVTDWDDLDKALFNVAEGIRRAIEELSIRRQARRIALFGYEMQGGRTSPLWADPSALSPIEAEVYKTWANTKRDFSSHELVGQTWVKTSNPEHTFIVHFFSDGSFQEYAISDPGKQWQGSWKLSEGRVRMRVNKYELDIFANQDSSVYSGIEFAQDRKEPHSYFVCFPLGNVPARHWDMNAVPELIEQIFAQILRQSVDTKLLITYGAFLCRGEMSVRNIVKVLGLSQQYRERFVNLKKPDETIERLYATFLGRASDANSKLFRVKAIQTRGSSVVIADLIDSEEYQMSFGEDALPPGHPHSKPVHMLTRLTLS